MEKTLQKNIIIQEDARPFQKQQKIKIEQKHATKNLLDKNLRTTTEKSTLKKNPLCFFC